MLGRSFLGTMVVAAALLAAASAAQAASWPYAIEVQVYEGPHDKTGQGWKSKTVALVPGSPEAQEWVDAHRRSNPGLVAAYERLTTTGPFTAHLAELLSLKGTRPKIHLVDDSRKYVDRDKDDKADTDAKAQEETGVWPHRRGGSIYISHSYFESYGEGAVEELLIHELSHTQDDTGRESGAYGPDGDHYADEILFDHGGGWKFWDRGHYSQRAAFLVHPGGNQADNQIVMGCTDLALEHSSLRLRRRFALPPQGPGRMDVAACQPFGQGIIEGLRTKPRT